MNHLLARHLLLVVLFTGALHGAADPLLAAVRAADDERVAATIAADPARLAAFYSDELRYVHSSGKTDDKAAHLAGIAKRENAYEKFDYAIRDFRSIGPGVVLMTGRVVIHSRNAKGQTANDVNFLAVWREENGRWRFLAWQACKNPPAEPAK